MSNWSILGRWLLFQKMVGFFPLLMALSNIVAQRFWVVIVMQVCMTYIIQGGGEISAVWSGIESLIPYPVFLEMTERHALIENNNLLLFYFLFFCIRKLSFSSSPRNKRFSAKEIYILRLLPGYNVCTLHINIYVGM